MTASRIDIFKQILESDPANGAVLFGLAKEYEKAGQSEYAAQVWQHGAALFPENKELQNKLANKERTTSVQ